MGDYSNFLEPQCAASSLGLANRLITSLVTMLLSVHCNISTVDMWPEDHGPIALNKGLETYDFIIVGAGTAGSTLAGRLAENPNFKILLIEAGENPPIESEIPGMSLNHLFTKYDWQYPTQSNGISCLAMKHESCIWHKGKALGGSGSINAMLYARGNPHDYVMWRESGVPDWEWEQVLPYFMKTENFGGENTFDVHGTGGPMSVQSFQSAKYDQFLILQAASELRIKRVDDYVDNNYVGFGFLYGTLEDGRRMSTAKAFLRKSRPNLHIIKKAVAKKIHLDVFRRASSLSFVYDGMHEMNVKVNREIIVSAGTEETPKLLMLSGIGPKTHLESFHIPVLSELPVGENLQDHTAATLFLKFEYKYKMGPEMRDLDTIYKQWVHRTGKYGIGPLDIGAFINTKKDSEFPDVQYIYIPVDDIRDYGRNLKEPVIKSIEEQLNPSDYLIAVKVLVLQPKSTGFVRLASTDYRDKPVVIPNSFQKDVDMETIIRGIRKQFEFLDTSVFQKHKGEFLRLDLPACNLLRYKSTKYWDCYIKHMTSSAYNSVGTAKMGSKRDYTAVVDPELKVKNIKGLRVVDASIMPNIISGNTNAPTVMIAERAADFIRRTWG